MSTAPQWLSDNVHNMQESETACEYCGISYLLLSRYEKMEARLREIEQERLELHVL
jgi:hypothetical protein